MSLSVTAVVTGRNDNYGGHLNESAVYSFNTLLETFDEVIYVDWNTDKGKKILTDEIDIKNRGKLKTITISPKLAKKFTEGKDAQKMCEVLARNIGIRRAKSDVIVSTNIDIIPPSRKYLDVLISSLKPMEMITVAKQDVELVDLDKQFGKTPNWNTLSEMITYTHGLWPLTKRLMCPVVEMNYDTIKSHPVQNHHTLSSLICACGDFQIARKDTWHAIKGFEESMIKRSYADTTVQYKVLMKGGTIRATNFPPVYHIEHERDNSVNLQNSIHMKPFTENTDTWGFSDAGF